MLLRHPLVDEARLGLWLVLRRAGDAGRGDVPLTKLRFRCSNCGSDRTDWVIASKGATAVQPWRSVPA